MSDTFALIETWSNVRKQRKQAEKWAALPVTSAFAGLDMGSGQRAPDTLNRALGTVVLRKSEEMVKEAILEMREQERRAFLAAMPEIQKLADALERFKKGIL